MAFFGSFLVTILPQMKRIGRKKICLICPICGLIKNHAPEIRSVIDNLYCNHCWILYRCLTFWRRHAPYDHFGLLFFRAHHGF